MATPAVIEIDSLVQPIPGDNPAGQPPSFALIQQLDEARKEGDPFDETPKKRDWPLIVRQATSALANQSKDLLIAARLVEAISFTECMAGLRDGLILMTRLLNECWDHLYPMPEEGEDMDVRAGPLLWLNAKFPGGLSTVPLVKLRGEDFSHIDWHGPRRAEFEASLGGLRGPELDKFKNRIEDVVQAKDALIELQRVADERMPNASLNLVGGRGTLSATLEEVTDTINEIAHKVGIGGDGGSSDEPAAEEESSDSGDSSAPRARSSGGFSRADLYRQIDSISDALQKMEPHSPIPYLLKRCVRLGSMAFPELMRAVIDDSRTIESLESLLGIQPPES